MHEDLLQYVWSMKLFGKHPLITTDGEMISIIKPGTWNHNAGPDFFNAKIKIDNLILAGNVELHVKSSDFKKHNHQKNKSYNNLVLHVVYENDTTENEIPHTSTLELKQFISPILLKKYYLFYQNRDWIPCQSLLKKTDIKNLSFWLERMLIEKWEHKSFEIDALLKLNQNNWEETFYVFVARHFGNPVNADAFELLARNIPLKTLAKCKNNLHQIEAILFGVSGLLKTKSNDEYQTNLIKEFNFLSKKFGLATIEMSNWKFSRMRPGNFPTIRIAQFASLIHSSSHLLSKIAAANTVKQLKQLLNLTSSEYWNTHYQFGKLTTSKSKQLGDKTIELLIVNAFLPFLFHYAKHHGNELLQQKCLDLMNDIHSEKNSVISKWNDCGIKATTAKETQGLLWLKKKYCSEIKCLSCNIGHQLLSTEIT